MKSILRHGAVSAIMVSFCAAAVVAQTSGPQPVRSAGPLADSLRRFAFRMADGLRSRDVREVIALYGDHSHFVHVEGGTVIPWLQLSAMMTNYLEKTKHNPLSIIGEPGVVLMDQNNAVLYVNHHFDGNGDQPAHDGVWSGVLHRFPEGWKIVHSHSSDRKRQ